MGQDGNTIEIEIDAAATQAAAKTAGEANAKLEEFNNALKLFRDNVGTISKTTDSVAGKIGDFNTLLQTFSDKLTENLANMQTSVVAKIEPHLERELENLVNRVTNKVEAKYKPETESRSRSEAKSGPAAPAIKVAQPPEYKQPDVKVKSTFTKLDNQTVDSRTGEVKETPIERARTTATRTRHWQEEIDGQLHDFTETITDVSSSVKKATTAEKDRGLAIRREITGALIGLHVMKVVSQYSAVFNAGFMQIAAAIGHLLNNLLLPMMPMFTQVAQFLHMLANVLAMLPMPVRQLIGALLIWKAASMMVAGLPIKDFADGIGMVKKNLSGTGDLLAKFGRTIVALLKFMNTNLQNDRVDAVAAWAGSGLRKIGGGAKKLLHRAGGGPVLGHGAYIVGEKGPEIFVPKTSGTIVPNHKIGRAEGGDVEAAPSVANPISGLGFDMNSLIGPLVGGSLGMLAGGWITGGPIGAAIGGVGGALAGGNMAALPGMMGQGVAAIAGSSIFQGIVGAMNVLTGTISSIFAPLAPIMGMMGAIGGLASGLRKGFGGGADMTPVIKAIQATSAGEQGAINKGHRGSNNILSLIYILLQGFAGILGGLKKLWDDFMKKPGGGGGTGEPGIVEIPTKWGNPGPITVPAITAAIIGLAWGALNLDDLKIPQIPPVTVPLQWGTLTGLKIPQIPVVTISVIWGTLARFVVPNIPPVTVPIKWGDIPGINITQIPPVTIPVNWDSLPPIVPKITTVIVPLIWGTLSALSLPRLTAVTVPVIWGTLSKLTIPAITTTTVPVRWGALLPFVAPYLAPVAIPIVWGKLSGLPATGVDVNVSPRINVQAFASVLSTLISIAFSNAWSSWKDRISAEEGDPDAEDRAWRERIRNMVGEMNGVFNVFINNLRTTLAQGVPIDVKIDIDSVTQTVRTVVDTIVSGVTPSGGGTTNPSPSGPTVPSPGSPVTPPTVPTVPVVPPTQVPVPVPGPTVPPVTAEPPAAADLTSTVTNILGAVGLLGLVGFVVNLIRTAPAATLGTALALAGIPANIISRLTSLQQPPIVAPVAMALGGTLVPDVPTLVGERGPELILPAGTGEVIPNNRLGSMVGGGGQTVTINQTFNVTTNNPRELTDTVMKELKMELARVKM